MLEDSIFFVFFAAIFTAAKVMTRKEMEEEED
jgi:hypothetical protein